MRRFSSLSYAPTETWRLLRDRFARFLPSPPRVSNTDPEVPTFADETMLRMLLRLEVRYANTITTARIAYETTCSPKNGEPSWGELLTAGWVRDVCGRFYTSFELSRAVPAAQMPALAQLLESRYLQTYKFNKRGLRSATLVRTGEAIARGEQDPHQLSCQSPEWVAARLWDRSLSGRGDLSSDFQRWLGRWELLGGPRVIPTQAWGQSDADSFRDAALDVLRLDSVLNGWIQTRTRVVREATLRHQQSVSDAEQYVPPVPASLVERLLWLEHPSLYRAVHEGLQARRAPLGAFGILLSDVEAQNRASVPHKIARQLLTLAMEDPEALFLLTLIVRSKPSLIADMVLFPPMAPLACLLIARWEPPGGAWDREICVQDDAASKIAAFTDAVGVMGHFLQAGQLDAQEAAGLLQWLHANAPSGFIEDNTGREPLRQILQDELATQSATTLRAMIAQYLPNTGLGTAEFAATLDVIDFGKLAGDIDPAPVVNAYLQSIATAPYLLSAHRIGIGAAASLYELAKRSSAAYEQRFLRPLDIASWLADAKQSEDNPYTVADTLVRSIRAHIRVLCRVVASCGDTVPNALADALIEIIRVGITTRVETTAQAEAIPLGTFSPRHEKPGFGELRDRPIPADLGAALSTLSDFSRNLLLRELLTTDEPMLLAGLLSYAPYALHGQITERLDELGPSVAGTVYSLIETQARIDALLSAGALDAAARFIDEERGLKTFGPVPGREIARLTSTLRLQLLREDWAAIEGTAVPQSLPPHEKASAHDTITFYQALSALRKPGGDRQLAESAFSRLQSKRPDIVAYAENLFAIRVTLLLQSDAFQLLRGADALRARQVLGDAEAMMRKARATGTANMELFSCNKALLLLAMGNPERAIEELWPFQHSRLRENSAAYMAIAQARVGHVAEGLSILRTAELALGYSELLNAAREHIENGRAYAIVAPVLSLADRLDNVRLAFHDLVQMEPTQQARVLRGDLNPFETLVVDDVRSAAASVMSLVPMMKVISLSDREDDLNALVGHLLSARSAFLGWSWKDQSKGGYTAQGNPGERDLTLDHKGVEQTVIEALVCRLPMTHAFARDDLKSHFQKLFAYTSCPLLFLIAYADVSDPASVLNSLRDIAAREPPPRFNYITSTELPLSDSKPPGFIARYKGGIGDMAVACLVVDIRKQPQLDAARAAGNSNPRRKRPRQQEVAPRGRKAKSDD
jgi:hypothetical protein